MERARRRTAAGVLERLDRGDRRRRAGGRPAARLAERAAEHGMRIAYEALAWGRHVRDYDHAWRIGRRATTPTSARASTPSTSSRAAPTRAASATSRREDLLPPARRRAAPRDGRAAVEPALPLLPGPGRVRPAGFLEHVLAAGYEGPLSLEVSTTSSVRPIRGGWPSTRGARCCCSRRRRACGAPARRAAARLRVRRAGGRAGGRGRRRAAADRDGLPPRRAAPDEGGAAVAPRRHARTGQPREGGDRA